MVYEEIRAAFPLHGVPRKDEIIVHACDECFALRDAFAGRRWSDIPIKQLREHSSALSLFSPIAHHYYLPAFLTAATDPAVGSNFPMLDMVIYDLCPSKRDPGNWSERFSLFSPAQLSCLAHWLFHVISHRDVYQPDWEAQSCFDEHWSEHLKA